MADPAAPFSLKDSERYSDAWRSLRRHFEAQLQRLRELNDAPHNDTIKTADIRGQIKVYKALLALDKSPPEPNSPPGQ